MPEFSKDGRTVRTDNKREAVRLRAAGYVESAPKRAPKPSTPKQSESSQSTSSDASAK